MKALIARQYGGRDSCHIEGSHYNLERDETGLYAVANGKARVRIYRLILRGRGESVTEYTAIPLNARGEY